MNRKLTLGIMTLAIAVLVSSAWSCTEKQASVPPAPPPPITPVTPGYVQSYDHRLGYGFEYPEDWEMQVPYFESPYEKVEVFTKKGETARIVVSVKLTNLKSLAEVRAFGYIDRESILQERFVGINDRKAYGVVFRQYPGRKRSGLYLLPMGENTRLNAMPQKICMLTLKKSLTTS